MNNTVTLVTNDYQVPDTVVEVLGYRVDDEIRYASVRLALCGDPNDLMTVELPLHKLEARRAA